MTFALYITIVDMYDVNESASITVKAQSDNTHMLDLDM